MSKLGVTFLPVTCICPLANSRGRLTRCEPRAPRPSTIDGVPESPHQDLPFPPSPCPPTCLFACPLPRNLRTNSPLIRGRLAGARGAVGELSRAPPPSQRLGSEAPYVGAYAPSIHWYVGALKARLWSVPGATFREFAEFAQIRALEAPYGCRAAQGRSATAPKVDGLLPQVVGARRVPLDWPG